MSTFVPTPRMEVVTAPKSIPNQDRRCEQIDALQRLSAEDRRERLDGDDFFEEIEGFYTLRQRIMQAPSYRPQITVPQLQTLMLSEATDLADMQPLVYIAKQDERDEAREKAIQAEWRQGFWNLELFMAELWANLSGTGIIQFGHDAGARNGRGEPWAVSRNPGDIFPDPSASCEKDLTYLIIQDRMYFDQIRSHFGDAANAVRGRGRRASSGDSPNSGSPAFTLQMTPGPMRFAGGGYASDAAQAMDDGRYRVRYAFIFDSSTKDVDPEVAKAAGGLLAAPKKVLRWPNGRLIIDCEGTVLFDGDNWVPHRGFPIVRFLGLPPLTGFWGVPPTRYTKNLQSIAEKMIGMTYENAIRLNNGTVMIDKGSGISADTYLGLPGEILTYNSGSQPPVIKWPDPMPQHLVTLPMQLLALQKELHGYTQTRQGNPGAGNVGSDLFDAAVGQAQKLTVLKGMFMARSVQRLAEQMFYVMAKFSPDQSFLSPDEEKGAVLQKWQRIGDRHLGGWNVWVDPGSVRPQSSSILRRMVPDLRKLGMIDTKSALEFLGIPNADHISELIETDQKIAALARLKRK